ncbi:hypothetical protein PLICRDRAFT_281101 [Plicaturopsis crispa FD-325 SS-3]|nr:hypothetical protein PLICRDRAFT_281101 [Plicaturopsis crispa FD-325 SS-3]
MPAFLIPPSHRLRVFSPSARLLTVYASSRGLRVVSRAARRRCSRWWRCRQHGGSVGSMVHPTSHLNTFAAYPLGSSSSPLAPRPTPRHRRTPWLLVAGLGSSSSSYPLAHLPYPLAPRPTPWLLVMPLGSSTYPLGSPLHTSWLLVAGIISRRRRHLKQRSIDILERSIDILKQSIDILERSIDVLERSIDILERSIDVLGCYRRPRVLSTSSSGAECFSLGFVQGAAWSPIQLLGVEPDPVVGRGARSSVRRGARASVRRGARSSRWAWSPIQCAAWIPIQRAAWSPIQRAAWSPIQRAAWGSC